MYHSAHTGLFTMAYIFKLFITQHGYFFFFFFFFFFADICEDEPL